MNRVRSLIKGKLDQNNANATLLKLCEYVEFLNSESKSGSLVVVEGRKDLKALRSIGFEGDVLLFNNFRGITHFVDTMSIRKRKVILLLDMDREGKVLTSKLLGQMKSRCRHDDLRCKHRLAQITKGRIKHIEELLSFSKRMNPWGYS